MRAYLCPYYPSTPALLYYLYRPTSSHPHQSIHALMQSYTPWKTVREERPHCSYCKHNWRFVDTWFCAREGRVCCAEEFGRFWCISIWIPFTIMTIILSWLRLAVLFELSLYSGHRSEHTGENVVHTGSINRRGKEIDVRVRSGLKIHIHAWARGSASVHSCIGRKHRQYHCYPYIQSVVDLHV